MDLTTTLVACWAMSGIMLFADSWRGFAFFAFSGLLAALMIIAAMLEDDGAGEAVNDEEWEEEWKEFE